MFKQSSVALIPPNHTDTRTAGHPPASSIHSRTSPLCAGRGRRGGATTLAIQDAALGQRPYLVHSPPHRHTLPLRYASPRPSLLQRRRPGLGLCLTSLHPYLTSFTSLCRNIENVSVPLKKSQDHNGAVVLVLHRHEVGYDRAGVGCR